MNMENFNLKLELEREDFEKFIMFSWSISFIFLVMYPVAS